MTTVDIISACDFPGAIARSILTSVWCRRG